MCKWKWIGTSVRTMHLKYVAIATIVIYSTQNAYFCYNTCAIWQSIKNEKIIITFDTCWLIFHVYIFLFIIFSLSIFLTFEIDNCVINFNIFYSFKLMIRISLFLKKSCNTETQIFPRYVPTFFCTFIRVVCSSRVFFFLDNLFFMIISKQLL